MKKIIDIEQFGYRPQKSTQILNEIKKQLRKRKYKVTDERTIAYADSPTGRVQGTQRPVQGDGARLR